MLREPKEFRAVVGDSLGHCRIQMQRRSVRMYVAFWPLTSFTAPQKCGHYRIRSGHQLAGRLAASPLVTQKGHGRSLVHGSRPKHLKSGARDGSAEGAKYLPRVGNALKGMHTEILELNARARD
jgi:hypothetical protein